jgi:uncharacterized repeat protein (TIGR02543 family)
VTFFENDSGADATSTFQISTAPQDLTKFLNLNVQFTNPGYTFAGWNTEANGSGTSYGDGANYSFSSDMSLYAQWTAVPIIHTVTFLENDTGADIVSTFETSTSPQNLTSFSNLNVPFSNPGYSFDDWNTSPDGSGTSYPNGSIYSFSADASLYAQWSAEPNVTATFNDNEGIGTVAPIIEPSGSTITLPTGVDLTRTDFTLEGWNSSVNGSGTEYLPGASLVLIASATYYAQWTETSPLEVQFLDNGGTGSDPPLSGNEGTTVTLPGSTGLIESGYTLTSWNTAANGSGTSYGLSQSVLLTEPLTLYAQWTEISPMEVQFVDNGGTGSEPPLSGDEGTTVTLPGASSIVRPGFTLSSWNTAADGSGISYGLSQSVLLTEPLTLYAQWTETTTTISVSFDANGGSGSLASLSGASGASVTLPGASSIVRPGFTLASWNSASNGSGTSYSPGQSLTLTSTLTLYAQWKSVPTSTLVGAVGTFAGRSTDLTPALEKQVRSLAATIRTRRYTKVLLFGFTAATGVTSLDHSLSTARADNVANYLRTVLRSMNVDDVDITSSGQGSLDGSQSASNSRVEVFVT